VATFRVFLRGANFLMEVNGKPTRIGFFTTRFVRANNRDGAELLAVDLIRSDKWLAGAVSNPRSDPPTIHAEEIEMLEGDFIPDIGAGFSFFPMDGSDA
jgi:hypothetical protein